MEKRPIEKRIARLRRPIIQGASVTILYIIYITNILALSRGKTIGKEVRT